MAYTNNTYSLSTIFQYEAITRQYCISEGGVELTTQELIQLSTTEDEFNLNYVNYLLFKHLYQISNYISHKTQNRINVKDTQNGNILLIDNEDYYEDWIEFYSSKSFSDYPDVYEIIDQAISGENWDVLYYIYRKEEDELANLVAKEEDEFNERIYEEKQKNRKFFII